MKLMTAIAAAAIFGASLIESSHLISQGVKALKPADRHVQVKGLAERTVRSDRATLRFALQTSGHERTETFPPVAAAQKLIVDRLRALGFKEGEIEIGQWSTDEERSEFTADEMAAHAELPRHLYATKGSVRVDTGGVELAAKAYSEVNELIQKTQGTLSGASVGYAFTGLQSIRAEMIAEATKDARNAALQFAKDSGSKVGVIRDASQGVFSILDKGQHDVARPSEGATDSTGSSLEKAVRVVTSVDYELVD